MPVSSQLSSANVARKVHDPEFIERQTEVYMSMICVFLYCSSKPAHVLAKSMESSSDGEARGSGPTKNGIFLRHGQFCI